MASKPSDSIVLLPIKPQYAEAILRGEKKVEFRKKKFKKSVRYVVVYASAPKKEVIGYFEIAGIDEGSPKEIWNKYSRYGCIELEEYFDYFSNTETAIGFEIGDLYKLLEPIKLSELRYGLKAPQNYCYLKEVDFNKIAKKSKMGTFIQ